MSVENSGNNDSQKHRALESAIAHYLPDHDSEYTQRLLNSKASDKFVDITDAVLAHIEHFGDTLSILLRPNKPR